MKIDLLPFLFLVAGTLLACQPDDAPLLIGDINGKVELFDGYGYPLQDKSGVEVQLSNGTFYLEGATDLDGQYSFTDLPFGNYHINLIKEDYIESILDFQLGHVGGEVPTFTSQAMNQIPEYRFTIDSLTYNGSHRLYIYMEAIEVNRPFANKLKYVHCFFSHSADVSAESFDHSIIEYFSSNTQNNKYYVDWIWWDGWYNFLKEYADSDSIYLRVYPQTNCDEIWYDNSSTAPHEAIPETLGKPSEVIAFTLEEITRDF